MHTVIISSNWLQFNDAVYHEDYKRNSSSRSSSYSLYWNLKYRLWRLLTRPQCLMASIHV